MTTIHPRRLAALLLLLTACGRGDAPASDSTRADTAAAPPRDTSLPPRASASAEPPPLPWQFERERDLTGDGRPERFLVTATGRRAEGLTVSLRIASSEGRELYAASWPSAAYFKYAYPDDRSEAGLMRAVYAHASVLLADSAFVRRAIRHPDGRVIAWVDTTAVEGDLQEHARDRARPPRSRVTAVTRELSDRPQFTYFGGGEETYSLAWSDIEKRLVKVHSCC